MNKKNVNHKEIKIRELEADNDRNNRLLHMIEIKREVKIVKSSFNSFKKRTKRPRATRK